MDLAREGNVEADARCECNRLVAIAGSIEHNTTKQGEQQGTTAWVSKPTREKEKKKEKRRENAISRN